MFQNINEDTIEINNKAEKAKRNVNIFSNVLTKENLAIYVVAFMMSLVGIGGDFSIFSISVLGACFASSVPALGVVAVSLLGNFIKFGVGGGLGYFLTTLVLIITLFIFKPRYNEEERNEKIKIGKNVFIATLLIQIIKIAMAQFTLYDVLASITLSITENVERSIILSSMQRESDIPLLWQGGSRQLPAWRPVQRSWVTCSVAEARPAVTVSMRP